MADSAVSSWTALAGADLAAGDLFPVIDISAVGAAKNKSMVPAEIRIGLYGAFSGSFASLTSKPTTIAGYGLTDAASLSTNTFTGVQTLSANSAAGSIPLFLSGTWAASTTAAQLLIESSARSVAFAGNAAGTGLAINSAATFTGNLVDFQLNGTSKHKIRYDGVVIPGLAVGNLVYALNSNVNSGIGNSNSGNLDFWSGGGAYATFASDRFAVGSATKIGFSSSFTGSNLDVDAFFVRGGGAAIIQMGADAAGVTNQHFKACNRITSDGVGADLTLSGGNGRGGAGGSLILATYSTAGAATAGTLTNHLTLDTSGVLTFANDVHMAFDTSSGTKFGTATTQKLAFYNATPIAQQGSIADPSGGATIDTEARAAIVDVISRLETIGLIATV